jgi:hypothetical protein
MDEVIKYWGHVMGPGAGLGMALKTEGRPLAVMDPLQGTIEK